MRGPVPRGNFSLAREGRGRSRAEVALCMEMEDWVFEHWALGARVPRWSPGLGLALGSRFKSVGVSLRVV